jgi:DNA-binding beta-propeller fold protein YncE
MAITRDGKNLYVAAYTAQTISHFIIGPDNNLIYSGCIGNDPDGCNTDIGGGALAPNGVAVTPDGTNLYVGSADGLVTHFRADAAGNLSYADCNGNFPGCTPISPGGALGRVTGVVVSPDGLNVNTSAAHAVTHFRLGGTGNLYFAGCTGHVTGCRTTTPAKALDNTDALATTSDGARLYVTAYEGSAVSRFGVDSAGT